MRCNFGSGRSGRTRGHLSGGRRRHWMGWTNRQLALRRRRRNAGGSFRRTRWRDRPAWNCRRLSLCSRRDSLRCNLGSRRSVRPCRHLSGGRLSWMACGRRCSALRLLSSRRRRRWLLGRYCRSGSRRCCRGSRLLRRRGFRLLLGLFSPFLFRLSGLCQHDYRLANNRGRIFSCGIVRNTGFGRLNRHNTGKYRAGHE